MAYVFVAYTCCIGCNMCVTYSFLYWQHVVVCGHVTYMFCFYVPYIAWYVSALCGLESLWQSRLT